MNIKIISRGKGHSAVAAAAYRAADIIKNEYDGQIHDYTQRNDVIFTSIQLPDNAPEEYYCRKHLWNAVEKAEKSVNAQLARSVRVALPRELDFWENVALIEKYVQENFTAKGMCADIAIHDKNDGNPHAHILLAMRPLDKKGNWIAKSRMEYILDDNGERIKLPSGRYKTKKISTTNWDSQENAEMWRENWANAVNKYLEHYGYEARIDHRSYERQGLEILPTIHLGSVAYGLEKRGIATERGNINRQIKKANEKLKLLDNEIHKLKNPPKPKLLIDIENSIKAKESIGYENWCRIFNLQQAAQTLLYIQSQGFKDINSLQTAHQEAKTNHAEIQNQMREIEAQIKNLTAQKTQAETYRKTLDVYKKYNAPHQLPYFKNKYYENHKADIEAHQKAKTYLFNEIKLEKFPSLKRLSGEISELNAKKKELQQSLKSTRKNIKELSTAEQNINMLLGFKKLETTGYTPSVPQNGLRFTMPYESSFKEAQKAEETKEYFQSVYADIDCAQAIIDELDTNKIGLEICEGIIKKYGKERTEKVVATFVNNAPDDVYTEHKEWASRITKNAPIEPTVRNTEVFSKLPHDTERMDFIIMKFKQVIGKMVIANYKFNNQSNDSTNGTIKQGWASESEIPKPEPPKQDNAQTFAERLAEAEQKVKEQERKNREAIIPPKPKKKRNDIDR